MGNYERLHEDNRKGIDRSLVTVNQNWGLSNSEDALDDDLKPSPRAKDWGVGFCQKLAELSKKCPDRQKAQALLKKYMEARSKKYLAEWKAANAQGKAATKDPSKRAKGLSPEDIASALFEVENEEEEDDDTEVPTLISVTETVDTAKESVKHRREKKHARVNEPGEDGRSSGLDFVPAQKRQRTDGLLFIPNPPKIHSMPIPLMRRPKKARNAIPPAPVLDTAPDKSSVTSMSPAHKAAAAALPSLLAALDEAEPHLKPVHRAQLVADGEEAVGWDKISSVWPQVMVLKASIEEAIGEVEPTRKE
ncbi:hypothetical protein BDV96DRAFT_597986 [Lophiotrema nucula]|uniref:Uncharacterized protein n=1 Tax=Lophiotrema nucula TaxID=690887 RepID=A0A6A5ZC27_9PLEO|nr:hypothetical protein BDV96DRAFT_597986 [Lophiotrema nucula]